MEKIINLLNYGINKLSNFSVRDARVNAEIILSRIINCNNYYLYLNSDKYVNSEIVEIYKQKINLRNKNIPLIYLVNEVEFMGLVFEVLPGIFIPRQETEILVETVIKYVLCITEKTDTDISYTLDKMNTYSSFSMNILDLCSGCGNISISIGKIFKNFNIVGIDISKNCVKISKKNAIKNNVNNVFFYNGDLFEPLYKLNLSTKFDFIVSNPPYIKTEDIKKLQPEIKSFEPIQSIDGGYDGFEFYRRIASKSKVFLKNNGYIIVEIGYNQAKGVSEIFSKSGYKIISVNKDFNNIDRVMVIQWKE